MLNIMIKPVSGSCDLRCSYCFYADVASHRETRNYGRMTPKTSESLIRRAFIEAGDDGIFFSFQGGEPTLAGIDYFTDFVHTVDRYNVRRIPVSFAIQTNACSLDGKLCDFFRENGFLCGVSLDGTREIHDQCRKDADGNGTYEKVRQGIAMLRRHGVDFNILCVVTKEICRHAEDVWAALAPYQYLQFIPCVPPFNGNGEKEELCPDAAEYGDFLCRIYDLYESRILAGNYVSERRFDNYMAILAGGHPEMCGMCGICGEYYLAEADGSVYPCDFYVLDEYRMGSVNDLSLRRLGASDAARRFREEGSSLPDGCRLCEYRRLCLGGCRRDREPFGTGTNAVNRFCESYRRLFSEKLEKMTALVEKAGR